MASQSVRVTRILGDEITAEHAEWQVPSGLRTSVLNGIGFHEVLGRPLVERWIPSATATLMIGCGGAPTAVHYTVGTPPPSSAPSSMVIAMHQRAGLGERRSGKMIEIELHPIAAYTLFGLPLQELAGQFVELPHIIGRGAVEVTDRLTETPDWPGRFGVLQDMITQRLDDGPVPDRAVAWAWQRIHRSHGRVNIVDLAAEVGWSRRHLTRQFSQQLGLAPKTVARLRRLRYAVHLLSQPCRRSIAEIAASCGYYDQAHLDLDFRDVVGCSPTEYLAETAAERARLNVQVAR